MAQIVAQNGWPVVNADAMDTEPIIGRVYVPGGILRGDVATVLRWVASQYNSRVEALIPNKCWGYDKRKISGSDEWSTHAAGCAVDFNAFKHNMGDAPSKSFTREQIGECHAIENESGGVIRWGGDFGRADGMHWEIRGTPDEVAAFAREIEGDDEMRFPREGDSGEVVKFWQFKLEDLGYDLGTVDGVYGPKTTAAVNAHRKSHGEGPHTEITGWHARTIDQDLYGRAA